LNDGRRFWKFPFPGISADLRHFGMGEILRNQGKIQEESRRFWKIARIEKGTVYFSLGIFYCR